MKPLHLALAATLVAAIVPMAAARTEIPHALQPQIAAGADGRVWVVYAQLAAAPAHNSSDHAQPAPAAAHGAGHEQPGPGAAGAKKAKSKGGHGPRPRGGDLFVLVSNDGGGTFAAPIKIAHVPQLMAGNRRGPRIAAHGQRVTVTAIGDELLAFTSPDAGQSWSSAIPINDVPGCAREGLHDLAGSADGELFVTWLDLRNGRTELWAARSRDGGRTWSDNQPIYKSPDKSICECCHPSALFDVDGTLAVMWRNSIEGARDMWLTTRPKGATHFTAARKLGEGTWKINACPHDGGTLVALGGGKFGAVWQRAGEIFLTRAEGREVLLGKGRQPVMVSAPQGPIVLWHDGADLQIVPGAAAGANPAQRVVSGGRFPVAVTLPDGKGAVVAYERGSRDATSIAVERL